MPGPTRFQQRRPGTVPYERYKQPTGGSSHSAPIRGQQPFMAPFAAPATPRLSKQEIDQRVREHSIEPIAKNIISLIGSNGGVDFQRMHEVLKAEGFDRAFASEDRILKDHNIRFRRCDPNNGLPIIDRDPQTKLPLPVLSTDLENWHNRVPQHEGRIKQETEAYKKAVMEFLTSKKDNALEFDRITKAIRDERYNIESEKILKSGKEALKRETKKNLDEWFAKFQASEKEKRQKYLDMIKAWCRTFDVDTNYVEETIDDAKKKELIEEVEKEVDKLSVEKVKEKLNYIGREKHKIEQLEHGKFGHLISMFKELFKFFFEIFGGLVENLRKLDIKNNPKQALTAEEVTKGEELGTLIDKGIRELPDEDKQGDYNASFRKIMDRFKGEDDKDRKNREANLLYQAFKLARDLKKEGKLEESDAIYDQILERYKAKSGGGTDFDKMVGKIKRNDELSVFDDDMFKQMLKEEIKEAMTNIETCKENKEDNAVIVDLKKALVKKLMRLEEVAENIDVCDSKERSKKEGLDNNLKQNEPDVRLNVEHWKTGALGFISKFDRKEKTIQEKVQQNHIAEFKRINEDLREQYNMLRDNIMKFNELLTNDAIPGQQLDEAKKQIIRGKRKKHNEALENLKDCYGEIFGNNKLAPSGRIVPYEEDNNDPLIPDNINDDARGRFEFNAERRAQSQYKHIYRPRDGSPNRACLLSEAVINKQNDHNADQFNNLGFFTQQIVEKANARCNECLKEYEVMDMADKEREEQGRKMDDTLQSLAPQPR